MMPIYICEDSLPQLKHLAAVIDNIILMEDLDAGIRAAESDPSLILQHLSNHRETGLYFLDIDLGSSINGFDLAKEIRQWDPLGFIVFITTHDEMMPLTFSYQVAALDYILKDNPATMNTRIKECLLSAMARYRTAMPDIHDVLTVKINGTFLTIKLNDIYYIETTPEHRKICIHQRNQATSFTATLKEVQESLNNNFLLCRKGCIVNRQHIHSLDTRNRCIQLDNGIRCDISVRLMGKIVSAFQKK